MAGLADFIKYAPTISIYEDGGSYLSQYNTDELFRNSYNTPLTPKEYDEYLKWKEANNIHPDEDIDYDTQGLFLEVRNNNFRDARGHSTDKYKKPNHPTFSKGSKWANEETGFLGGEWSDKGYTAPSNLLWTPDRLEKYMSSREKGLALYDNRLHSDGPKGAMLRNLRNYDHYLQLEKAMEYQ